MLSCMPGSGGVVSYPWVQAGSQVRVDPGLGSYGAVAPAVEKELRGLAHEIPDEQIERDKPGHRGLFLGELRGILAACDAGDPDDPRWYELKLRALDRMAKLLRVYEADAPSVKAGPGDARILASQAAAALAELEASLAETRSA